jgi:sigma-B regulation protein RsbU (phosphoserine phosphatase)
MALLMLSGTSLVFALVLGYSYYYSRKIILDEAEMKARNLTLSVANKIEQEFRAVTKVPQHLASFLKTNDYNRTTLGRIIREMVADNPEVFGSAVGFESNAFEEGVQSYSPYYYRTRNGLKYLQLGSASYNYFQRDWYHIPKVLKEPVWIEPYFDRGGGGIIITTYSFPLLERAKDGAATKVKAIVSADISLEWLTWLVSSIRLGRTGYGFIMSDIGTIVTHPREEWIMRQSIFSLAEEYGDSRLRQIGRAMIREKSGFVELGSTLAGEDAFLAYARIPSPGWSLGAVFPKSEIFEKVTGLYERTVLLAGLGVVLLLIVSALVARSMARPLLHMSEATRRVARGDLDIDLSGIRRKDEVGQLAQAFTRMAAGLQERERMQQSLNLAKEVQQNLLPKSNLKVNGFDIAGKSIYCDETGGDYYDFISIQDADKQKIGVAIGDVSGHGISSALLMATVRSSLRQRASLTGNIAQIISDVNRQLVQDVEDSGQFMTMFFLALDTATRQLEWVRAGHDPAMLYDPGSDSFSELGGSGIALGVDAEWIYEDNKKTDFSNGQIIFLSTDGIWEARNKKGEMLGKEPILNAIRQNSSSDAAQIIDAIFDILDKFIGEVKIEDDITSVIIKMQD